MGKTLREELQENLAQQLIEYKDKVLSDLENENSEAYSEFTFRVGLLDADERTKKNLDDIKDEILQEQLGKLRGEYEKRFVLADAFDEIKALIPNDSLDFNGFLDLIPISEMSLKDIKTFSALVVPEASKSIIELEVLRKYVCDTAKPGLYVSCAKSKIQSSIDNTRLNLKKLAKLMDQESSITKISQHTADRTSRDNARSELEALQDDTESLSAEFSALQK